MGDNIKIIEQTTAERNQETQELWKQVEPLLQKGYPLTKAVAIVKNLNHFGFQNRAWYKEVREIALSKGYYLKR